MFEVGTDRKREVVETKGSEDQVRKVSALIEIDVTLFYALSFLDITTKAVLEIN